MSEQNSIKCVVVGDGAVGKTCMLISYSTDHFPEEYVPTVFDNYRVEVSIGNKTASLELWDTAGQEAYDQLRPLSYPDTDIFLIAYSCVDRNSFNNVEKWFKELNQHWKDTSRPVPLFLVGTKKDLISDPATLSKLSENKETIVTMEEAEAMAKKLNAGGCLQCSAKTQEGLKPVFDSAVNYVLELRTEEVPSGGCCTVL
ncbi:hypothetical protein WA171_000253 [Blastocystis sp. BT1]